MNKLFDRFRRRPRAPQPTVSEPDPAPAPIPDSGDPGYSGDQPIKGREQDRFGRWSFAERIAHTLAERRDPSSVVIGIYGAWGDGKTSTLRLMSDALRRFPNVILVQFNPWQVQSEDQLLRSFFSTLAASADKSLSTRREEFGDALKRYGSVLSLVSIGAGPISISPGAGAKDLGESLSAVELPELRTRLEKILEDLGKRLVILIDDVDRLDRKEIQAVFKLVKLSAGFDHTSYVLAFDDEMVAAALGEQYGGGGSDAGRAFLEKIVQVPLHLPPADSAALRRMTFEGVDAALNLSGIQLSESQGEAFVRHFVDGIEPRLETPRQARLYGNVLSFALPILKGEVNPVDQMLIEAIRAFYPRLYEVIRDHRGYFMTRGSIGGGTPPGRDRARELITDALAGTGVDPETVIHRLLEVLFPRLKTLLGNTHYGSDWDTRWAREQRVCSDQYFDRYFRYGVPPGDLPDLRLAALLDTAMTDPAATALDVQSIATTNGMGTLITKLRQREDHVPAPAAASLALAIAQNGSSVPRERQMLIADWSFMQGAILIAHLVRQIPVGEARYEIARTVIRIAEPLTFATECMRWLRKRDDQDQGEAILPLAAEDELGRELANRIRTSAAETPLYETYGQDTPRLFWFWNRYGEPGGLAAHIRRELDADAQNVDAFVGAFLGTAWGVESGLSHKADLERETYDAIATLVDTQLLYDKLQALHGDLSAATYYHDDEVPTGRRVAEQFAVIHKRVQEEKAAPSAAEPPSSEPGDSQ